MNALAKLAKEQIFAEAILRRRAQALLWAQLNLRSDVYIPFSSKRLPGIESPKVRQGEARNG
jgi:hypothetical protein